MTILECKVHYVTKRTDSREGGWCEFSVTNESSICSASKGRRATPREGRIDILESFTNDAHPVAGIHVG